MKVVRWIIGLFVLPGLLCCGCADQSMKEEVLNPKEVIFEHLQDEYGWKIGKLEIPLPVIVNGIDGKWHVFSSRRLENRGKYEGFYLATTGTYAGKVVEADAQGKEYRPWDLSVTKNALALMICAGVVCWLLFPLVYWYRKHPYDAPRRVRGMMEAAIGMLYQEVIVPILGKDARRFAAYLLTVFFFILMANLLGLTVIFPGGANLTGNISITLVLAFCTFVVVNFSGRKHYWKEVFWPEVPVWLKVPVPMMPVIEIFGILTKPVALMIRLFANILGGHLITLVLISLIFIFSAWGMAAAAGTTVVAVLFAVFMGLIDFLICFIQAYVFFMLSTIFIALARGESTPQQQAGEPQS